MSSSADGSRLRLELAGDGLDAVAFEGAFRVEVLRDRLGVVTQVVPPITGNRELLAIALEVDHHTWVARVAIGALEAALNRGSSIGERVWEQLSGPIARPNQGWKCSDCGDVHRGNEFGFRNGDFLCPDREGATLNWFENGESARAWTRASARASAGNLSPGRRSDSSANGRRHNTLDSYWNGCRWVVRDSELIEDIAVDAPAAESETGP